MSDSRIPNFPGINAPSTDFASVRDGRRARVMHYDVDLTNARSIAAGTALILNIAGNSFFSDQSASQGNATVYFQDFTLNPTDAPPIFVGPGFVADLPFTTLLIENAAQAGKRMRFFYGVDIDFKPSLSGTVLISGSVNTAAVSSLTTANAAGNVFSYTGSYKSTTLLAAVTPEQIFAPGANVNGAVLWRASFLSGVGAGIGAGMIAKNAAPVSIIDGDLLVGIDGYALSGATNVTVGKLEGAVFITAGKGLYFISTGAETLASRSALFTLL